MFDAIKAGLAAATILNDGKYQAQLGLAMSLAAKEGKLDVKSLPHKYRQFEIPAVNVNRENVNQVVHDYLEATPTYDLSDFFAQWSVAILTSVRRPNFRGLTMTEVGSVTSLRKREVGFVAVGIGGQILSLVIVMGIFTIGTKGRYLSGANLQVILSLAAIPAIIAIGLHQVVVLGGIDLSVEGVVALCVVVVGFLAPNKFNSNDVGLWIVPIVVCFGGLAGIINGLLNTKLRIPSFISTLGMSWVLWGLAVFVSKGQTVPLLKNPLSGFVNGTLFGIPDLALVAFALFAGHANDSGPNAIRPLPLRHRRR